MRTVTLLELVKRLERAADIEKDPHISPDEKREMIKQAVAETWDKIISSGLSEQHVRNVSFNSVAGQLEYDLDSTTYVPSQDFYKVHQIYVNEGSGQLRPISRMNPAEIQAFRAPAAAIAIKLYYIPTAPTFKNTDGSWNDAATFDGINGWEEHSVMGAAIAAKKKKEDNYAPFRERKMELEQRIQSMANVDYSEPSRVVRRRMVARDPFVLYRNSVSAWGIRDNVLELYYFYGYVP